MDRAIPVSGNEEINLYIRTYYSLLRSSGDVRVKSLEEMHAGMNSSLHSGADEVYPDIGAFTYAYLRLPPVMTQMRHIILGQSEEVFARRGHCNVDQWELTEAPARRRKMFFKGDTLAAFIASVSDIDDLIPILVAFQIEWNKIHHFLAEPAFHHLLDQVMQEARAFTEEESQKICQRLSLDAAEWQQLQRLFPDNLPTMLRQIAHKEMRLRLTLLASSLTDYRRATEGWWNTIIQHTGRSLLRSRPIYFVSSNMHSLVNLLAGYPRREEAKLAHFLKEHNPESLWEAYQRLQKDEEALQAQEALPATDNHELCNLLYYTFKHYKSDVADKHQWEAESGIQQIENPLYLDVAAQVIEMNKLLPERFDPRLQMAGLEKLRRSNAIIFNIDYPLGMAAYQILSQVTTNVGDIRGIYIIGKAATLNGRVGDVMLPDVVYDDHSQNSYLFRNAFCADDLAPYLMYSTVFDKQKAVTVRGTLLQNRQFMGLFYKEGYTDIEMEAGPYLSAIYENNHPKRYPLNEIINLFINVRYDIGILHYASDTPYSKRQALLSESLSYRGVEATYACGIAVLRRIFEVELKHLDV